ncbi:MAG: HutD family protein [Oscillospiraceae bacterium]
MQSEIIRKTEYKTAVWAGGTTEEIYIYPPQSSYKERNFAFRLSSATVSGEASVFTALPGVSRTLLLLDGSVRLFHSGAHTAELLPGMQDTFSGGCETLSRGTGRDLNLMTMGGAAGRMACQTLLPKSGTELCCSARAETDGFLILYVLGQLALSEGGQTLFLGAGDSAVFAWEAGEKGRRITVRNAQDVKISFAAAEVWLSK